MPEVANSVSFSDSRFIINLVDGRTLSIPLAWFSTLSNATKDQREDYELIGNGEGIHWPQLDEDLSVKDLFLGVKNCQK